MHILRSKTIGLEVIDNIDHQVQGRIADVLIDPDKAKVIAFFIQSFSFSEPLILQTQDIATWGNRIHIRNTEVIGEVSDFIRLQTYFTDTRTVIHQPIRTKNGVRLGKCVDVQFRTDTFDVEWIFPRKFFHTCPALPTNEILEITKEAIIVKNQGPREEKIEIKEEVNNSSTETIPTPAVGLRTPKRIKTSGVKASKPASRKINKSV